MTINSRRQRRAERGQRCGHVAEDGSQLVNVRANDSDVDGKPFTVTSVGTPVHGNAVLQAGNVLYTPNANYNGADTFAYTISDGAGGPPRRSSP